MSAPAKNPLSELNHNTSYLTGGYVQQTSVTKTHPQETENIPVHTAQHELVNSAPPINSLGRTPCSSVPTATAIPPSSQLTPADRPPSATAPPSANAAVIVLKATCAGERCSSTQVSRLCVHRRCKRCCLRLKTPCGFKAHDSQRNHLPVIPQAPTDPFALSRPPPAIAYDRDAIATETPVSTPAGPVDLDLLSPRTYQAAMPPSILKEWDARRAAQQEKREAEEQRRQLELRMKQAVVLDFWTKVHICVITPLRKLTRLDAYRTARPQTHSRSKVSRRGPCSAWQRNPTFSGDTNSRLQVPSTATPYPRERGELSKLLMR